MSIVRSKFNDSMIFTWVSFLNFFANKKPHFQKKRITERIFSKLLNIRRVLTLFSSIAHKNSPTFLSLVFLFCLGIIERKPNFSVLFFSSYFRDCIIFGVIPIRQIPTIIFSLAYLLTLHFFISSTLAKECLPIEQKKKTKNKNRGT